MIRYEEIVNNCLMKAMQNIMNIVEKNGLHRKQHFYITFLTTYPGVIMPEYLKERYGEDITIVIQHEFWNLKVFDDFFVITLNFSGKNETLSVPFRSITNFVDPSEKFGLQFSPDLSVANRENIKKEMQGKTEEEKPKDNVIRFDFSNKKK